MSENIPRFQVHIVPDCHPEIGRWLGILDDARKRLQFALRPVQDADLDAPPPIGINTIGTILYHIAMADLNWLYDNLPQQPYPADTLPLFPYPITDANHLAQHESEHRGEIQLFVSALRKSSD
jgi:uncharacterized damage-inducible protein DinB